MCLRYTLIPSELDLSFLGINHLIEQPPSYNISPGEQVLIVRAGDTGNEAVRAKWGLAPSWLKYFSRVQYNARLETAATKPMFRNAMESRRCLIVADGWFDWQRLPDRNQPWYFRANGKKLLFFAGLWERYSIDDSMSFDSCAILTAQSSSSIQAVSGRMPVVLNASQVVHWLSGSLTGEQLSEQVIHAGSSETWIQQPVSLAVNRTSNKRPECIKPIH